MSTEQGGIEHGPFDAGAFDAGVFDAGVFDADVAGAWQRFEKNLTAHVAAMPTGSYVTITSAQASHGQRGQRPYVDLVAIDGDVIVGVASLPSYLYPDDVDMTAADRRLHGLGWSEAGKPMLDGTVMDFTVDGPRDEADLLATVAVATFREVWDVPHPSFLSAWTVGLADGAGGPVALAHEPHPVAAASAERKASAEVPEGLRSLHTFCELAGGPLDSVTVASLCGADRLDELAATAGVHADRATARAFELRRRGTPARARVWEQQARSWSDTAVSLRRHLGSASSLDDRPAKSAGS
ncbi:MAG: hypothetical protein ABW364_22765 [Rhodococcus fascians]